MKRPKFILFLFLYDAPDGDPEVITLGKPLSMRRAQAYVCKFVRKEQARRKLYERAPVVKYNVRLYGTRIA